MTDRNPRGTNLFRILALLAMFLVSCGDLRAAGETAAYWASLLHGSRSALGKVHVDVATLGNGFTFRPIPNPSGSGFILRAANSSGQFANLSHPTLRAYLDQVGTRVFPTAEAATRSAGAYRGHLTRQVTTLQRHYAGEIGRYSQLARTAPPAPAAVVNGATPRPVPTAATPPVAGAAPPVTGAAVRPVAPVTPGAPAVVPGTPPVATGAPPVTGAAVRPVAPVTPGAPAVVPGTPPVATGAPTTAVNAPRPAASGTVPGSTAATAAENTATKPGLMSRLSSGWMGTALSILGHAGTGQMIVNLSDSISSGQGVGAGLMGATPTSGMRSFVGSLAGAGAGYWLGSVVAGALGPYGNLAKAGLAIAGAMMGTRAGAGQDMQIGKALFSAAAAIGTTAALAALVTAGAPAILGGALVGFIASTIAGVGASVLYDKLFGRGNRNSQTNAASRRFSGNRVFAGGTTSNTSTTANPTPDPAGVTLLQNNAATN